MTKIRVKSFRQCVREDLKSLKYWFRQLFVCSRHGHVWKKYHEPLYEHTKGVRETHYWDKQWYKCECCKSMTQHPNTRKHIEHCELCQSKIILPPRTHAGCHR